SHPGRGRPAQFLLRARVRPVPLAGGQQQDRLPHRHGRRLRQHRHHGAQPPAQHRRGRSVPGREQGRDGDLQFPALTRPRSRARPARARDRLSFAVPPTSPTREPNRSDVQHTSRSPAMPPMLLGMHDHSGAFDTDVLIVGSGFGGAVSALRLSEQGRRVIVLEQGRRHTRADFAAARRDPRKYLWMPELGLRGFFWQRVLAHVGIIAGVGVGGGSIVWAGVLLEPEDDFFTVPAWPRSPSGWRAELAPHYATAARMLGRAVSPFEGPMDLHLRATAEALGAGHTYGPTPMAIYWGEEGVTVPDPFFGGEGPERTGCRLCGACLIGCAYGSKNTLDLNYLWLAERRGAQIRSEQQVTEIAELPGGGYEVRT